MRYFLHLYLSLSGRITRREYALYVLCPVVALAVTALLLESAYPDAAVWLWLPTFWMLVCGTVKRLHDTGLSGWKLTLIPLKLVLVFFLSNIATVAAGNDLGVLALFLTAGAVVAEFILQVTARGDRGENRFGGESSRADFKTNTFRDVAVGLFVVSPAVAIVALFIATASAATPASGLGEYQSGISTACTQDSDCAIKDVGNCCGYYPQCVNKDAKTDPGRVAALCAKEGMAGVCGFPSISGCRCVEGQCEGFFESKE